MLLRDADLFELDRTTDTFGKKLHYEPPRPYATDSSIQPCSVDLRIGKIYVPDVKEGDPGSPTAPKTYLELGPGETAIIETVESLKMPGDIAGIGFPPHEVSSKGLLTTNPGHVDPGYVGTLSFTVINMGREKYVLKENELIVTLLLFKLQHTCESDYSQRGHKPASGVTEETLSKLSRDFLQIRQRATDIAKDRVRRAVSLSIVVPILVAVITVIGSIIAYNQTTQDKIHDLDKQVAVLQQDLSINGAGRRLTHLETRIDHLNTEVKRLKRNHGHR